MRARQHQLVMNEWFPDYFDPNSNAQAFDPTLTIPTTAR